MARLDRAAAQYEQAAKPFLIVIFMVLALMPFYLQLGPLRMTPIRFFLLIAFIPLVLRWLSGRHGGIIMPDILLALHGLWMFIASFIYFVRILLVSIVLLIPFALIENITNKLPISMFFDSLPGFDTLIKEQNDVRMGLFRAQATFPHPISWGVYCATIFALAWFVPIAQGAGMAARIFWSVICTVGSFLSLSSGAILSVGMQFALVGYHMVTGWLKMRWLLLFGGFIALYILIDLLSNRSPIEVFISKLAFSAHNGYYRIEIFNYGWLEVEGHPIFGIGQREFNRPWWMHSASVDNFWLLTAMRYGIPGVLLMMAGFLVGLFKVGFMDFSKRPDLAACQRGYIIAMAGLFFSLTTVHLWASAFAFIFLLFGSGIWMYTSELDLGTEDEVADGPTDRAAPARDTPKRRAGLVRKSLDDGTERNTGVTRSAAPVRKEANLAERKSGRYSRGTIKPTPKR